MIVAGRLLAMNRTHGDLQPEGPNAFDDWLSEHDLTRREGRWLADRRDPTPLERPAWLDRDHGNTGCIAVTPADFDEALMTRGLLSVWGEWWTTDWTTIRWIHIRSALVSSARSHALLRALRDADGPRLYEIPTADPSYGHEIDRVGFALKGLD